MIELLKQWLGEQANALVEQHAQQGEDRLRIEGRHQACEIFMSKIVELESNGDLSVEAEALSATDAEEAAAEGSL